MQTKKEIIADIKYMLSLCGGTIKVPGRNTIVVHYRENPGDVLTYPAEVAVIDGDEKGVRISVYDGEPITIEKLTYDGLCVLREHMRRYMKASKQLRVTRSFIDAIGLDKDEIRAACMEVDIEKRIEWFKSRVQDVYPYFFNGYVFSKDVTESIRKQLQKLLK